MTEPAAIWINPAHAGMSVQFERANGIHLGTWFSPGNRGIVCHLRPDRCAYMLPAGTMVVIDERTGARSECFSHRCLALLLLLRIPRYSVPPGLQKVGSIAHRAGLGQVKPHRCRQGVGSTERLDVADQVVDLCPRQRQIRHRTVRMRQEGAQLVHRSGACNYGKARRTLLKVAG